MIWRYPCFRKPPSLLRFICCDYYVFFLKEQGQLFRGGRARFTPVVGRLPHPKTTNLRLLQTTFLSLLSVWLSRKVWAQRFTVHVSSQMRLPLSLSWPLSSGFHFLFGLSFLDWTGLPSTDMRPRLFQIAFLLCLFCFLHLLAVLGW